ncbi:MAG: hypothetical protein ACREJU_02160 [Nitrospiraceae bacterium]
MVMRETSSGLQVLLMAAAVASVGCAPAKVTTAASPAIEQYRVQTVVVMPFKRLETPQILDSPSPEFSVPGGAKRSDISMMVPPPSSEKLDLRTTTVPDFVPEQIAGIMYDQLRKRTDLRVLSPDDAKAAIRSLGKGTTSPEQAAREVAGRLGVDAALLGRVLVYRERVGSKWGANPAVVGFEVKLVGTDGETLWSANYYEKQRPLIEDVTGFFQRGGVFVTAGELARYGAEHIVQKFPFGRP